MRITPQRSKATEFALSLSAVLTIGTGAVMAQSVPTDVKAPEHIIRYSLSIWPPFTLTKDQPVSADTPFGRLDCLGTPDRLCTFDRTKGYSPQGVKNATRPGKIVDFSVSEFGYDALTETNPVGTKDTALFGPLSCRRVITGQQLPGRRCWWGDAKAEPQ
jgi:hypothetical protein